MSRVGLERDSGTAVVEEVHREWQVDAEWSQWSSRGFAWWGHRFRQRVWAEPGFEDEGMTVYRVCVATDFAEDVPAGGAQDEMLADIARISSLAAPVHTPDTRRVSLFSSVYAHEDNARWIGRLLAHSAILQPIAAEATADVLAADLGGRPDTSAHPLSGPRGSADEMLGVLSTLYGPRGREPSPWAESAEFETVVAMLNQGNCFSTAGTGGLTAEFAFGASETTLLRALSDQRHPILGNGLMLQMHLPMALRPAEAAALAATLNRVEAAGRLRTPTLGSWTVDDFGRGPHPVFVTFVPAIMFRPGLLTNLVIYAAGRALRVGELLGEAEGGNAIEIILGRLAGRLEEPE